MLFFVLLRTAVTNHLCEIVIFTDSLKDLVKEPKNIPQVTSHLILAENIAGKKTRLTFVLS